MKIQVNSKIIQKLNPCPNWFDNWLKHYKNFNGDILAFLKLNKIEPEDKVWVALHLLRDKNELFTLQVFAIDCAFAEIDASFNAADCIHSDNVDDAAYYADRAALTNAFFSRNARMRQIESLIYLIKNYESS